MTRRFDPGFSLATALLGVACHGPVQKQAAWPQNPVEQELEGEPLPQVPDEATWSVRYKLPVSVGYTDFDLGGGELLDSLTALSVVPTAEFVRAVGKGWTLLPFIGLGGGWLIDEDQVIAILTTGVRAEWLHAFDERSVARVVPRIRYDANLNRPDGLLGDWGRADLALELRRVSGHTDDALRLEPGVYAQGFWFWDDIEFDVPGLTPDSVQTQLELGISLGTREPIEILGFELPRVFVGYRFGDNLETLLFRFGDL